MLHRKVIEMKIGNALRSLLLFMFTRQIPPSHQSKDNPLRQTRPLGVPADLQSADKKGSTTLMRI